MAKIQLSESAAMKIIEYSNSTGEELLTNVRIMDSNVNSNFEGLNDPVIKRYLELSEDLNDAIKQISQKTNDVAEYCKAVLNWIDTYKSS